MNLPIKKFRHKETGVGCQGDVRHEAGLLASGYEIIEDEQPEQLETADQLNAEKADGDKIEVSAPEPVSSEEVIMPAETPEQVKPEPVKPEQVSDEEVIMPR